MKLINGVLSEHACEKCGRCNKQDGDCTCEHGCICFETEEDALRHLDWRDARNLNPGNWQR